MTPYYDHAGITIYNGDCRDVLRDLTDESVNCVVTSPPYWGLRDYGVDGQLGLEQTPDEYVQGLVAVFSEVKRVLRSDGTVWLNLGDSYVGSGKGGQSEEKRSENWQPDYANKGLVPDGLKAKDLVGIPWRVAFALQADGWYLRSDIIWHKPDPMPESVKDRPTKSHEYIFLLSKASRYYYDADAIREAHTWANDRRNDGQRHFYSDLAKHNQVDPDRQRTKTDCVSFHPNGRNKRTVWTVPTQPTPFAHFATFPPKLIEPCIMAGCPAGGVVLDPFSGAGTAGMVAKNLGRRYVGIELNKDYCDIAIQRLQQEVMAL